MSGGVKIPVSADFNGADVEKSISRLNDQMNRLAQTVAQANRVKFTPIDKSSLDDLKKIEAKFSELTRVSAGLRERMKATGQSGSSFGGLDWGRMYEDPGLRARKMQQAYQHVTAGTGFSIPRGSGGVGGGGGAANGPSWGGVAGGAAGAGLRASGPVGGVIASAANTGMSGGLGAGMMGLLGGLAALAVGKGVSAVKEKVDAAGQEGVGYDTLKRTLGDVNVSFGMLRTTLRNASYDIDMTFAETQKLGTDFAKISGLAKSKAGTLGDEVSVGGGFGRSFGMDPSQSNQFFAQMRQFKVTEDTQGSRKLALLIGEAVGKSGSFAKADEMLSIIASFTANQARAGLSTPNVSGYSGMLAGMVGSRIPGLDPQGAAAMLSRVNGAISGGGANGEAGQNYMFNVLGKRNHLNPVQTMLLEQQGAFGTGHGAFGSQLYKSFSKKFGGGGVGGAENSNEMNITAILADLQKRYAGNHSMMLNATARTLGISETQAMALHTVGSTDLNGMGNRMGRLGLDLGKMSGMGISGLSQIEGGSHASLLSQASSLLNSKDNPLSKADAERLKAAAGGKDDEKLKDILTELSFTRGQEQTEGDKTRKSINDVEKRAQELATGLVGPMNEMRNAIVYMAGGGKKTRSQMAKEIAGLEYDETPNPLRDRKNQIDGLLSGNGAGVHWNSKVEDIKKAAKTRADLEAERADIEKKMQIERNLAVNGGEASAPAAASSSMTKKEFEEKYGAAAAHAGQALGIDKKLILGQWGLESGWGKSIVPGTNNPGNIKDFTGSGVAARDNATGSMDRYRQFSSPDDMALNYVSLIRNKYPKALNAGTDGAAFANGLNGYAEDPHYASKIMSAGRGLFSTPMPDGAPATASQQHIASFMIDGNFTLQNAAGQSIANPLSIKKRVFGPQPSGTQGVR